MLVPPVVWALALGPTAAAVERRVFSDGSVSVSLLSGCAALHRGASVRPVVVGVGRPEGASGVGLAGDDRRLDEDARAGTECSAILTYALWLRSEHLGGRLTAGELGREEGRVEALLERHAEALHLRGLLDRWRLGADTPVR